jgi:hypothetical protein
VNGSHADDPDVKLFVEVYNGLETVSFKFYNQSGPSVPNVSITDIYFDDGTLRQISGITNGPGTSFAQLATPKELPGAELLVPPFQTTDQFSADSDPPPPKWGVEPGEWMIIRFDLWAGGTLQDVIDEINDGRIRIGVHLQAFPDGRSESAIAVPEPATISLMALGVCAVLSRRRRY